MWMAGRGGGSDSRPLGVHASWININDALEALATGRVDGKAVRPHGDRSPAGATDVSRRSPSGLV